MMLAMGIERAHHNGPTPRSTNLKIISRLPCLLEEEATKGNTPRIQKVGTIVMSRPSRQRTASASSDSSRENGDLSKQTKFVDYKNSPKLVPRQSTDLQPVVEYSKRRSLSDSSAIRTDESPSHQPGSKSGNPYKTLRPVVREKVVRKVSFSDDLVVISDTGEVKAKRSHSARHIRPRDLEADGYRSNGACRYMHLVKGREDTTSHSDDLDTVYHGLTSLLGTKSKKDSERKTTKVQSTEKSSKQKVSKALSVPTKKVKKGSTHGGSV